MDGWGSRSRDELSDELDTWYEWENKNKNLILADTMFDAAKIVYDQYQLSTTIVLFFFCEFPLGHWIHRRSRHKDSGHPL